MDQVKIGKFIKKCRKDKSLTQQELADLLGVSFKTISKWECGNGVPEVSLMIPLCKELNISVNELLLGEHINKNDYMEKSEELILKLKKENERKNKNNLIIEVILIIISVSSFLGMVFASIAIESLLFRILLIVLATIILLVTVFISFYIEKESLAYVCPNCGKKINCTWKIILTSIHAGWDRKIKCPSCHKKSWMKGISDRD